MTLSNTAAEVVVSDIKKPAKAGFFMSRNFMAEWTGLEPATTGVTGRYSNQLNYHSVLRARIV